MSDDEKYMQMALRLAKRGIGSVEPNPAVGAVLVKGGRVIGKGYHRKFGSAHAEVNAIKDCTAGGENPAGAVIYVTLEPCCHQGKTPPCTEAIIKAGIAEVVVAAIDPSNHADSKGISQLREAGIQVRVGVCEQDAKMLNAAFFKYASTGKCWVVLKWAQTIDGKMARAEDDSQRWISNEKSRKDVQKLRKRVQGILVGVDTVIADDPKLTVRIAADRKPVRIVLDSNLRLPLDCYLLKTAGDVPVIIAAAEDSLQTHKQKAEDITGRGARLIACPRTGGRVDLNFLLDRLSEQGIWQLLVEGGPTVISSFMEAELADEICIYITAEILGSQAAAGICESMNRLSKIFDFHRVAVKRFGDNVRLTGLTARAVD